MNRNHRRNHLSEAVSAFISNGWDYFHGANGDGDGGDDGAADAAAAAARGDILPDPDAAEKEAAAKAAELTAKEAADKAAADKAAEEAEAAKNKTADELAEETEEEKAEREREEAEQDKKKRVRIPLSRHEEILEKARQREEQLKARLQELEKKDAPQQKDVLAEMKAAIDTLQDKYEEHVFKGEKDEAKQVRRQLDEAREKYSDTKVAQSSALARAQTIDTLKYEAALAKVESDYPALNPDADTFDEAKADEVADLLTLFARNGLTRQAALEKAVKYVMGTPAQKKEASKDNTAETLRKKQEEEARKKAAEADKKQPPDANKTGLDNDKAGGKDGVDVNVLKMSEKQFEKMDEETLAKLRGDVVA